MVLKSKNHFRLTNNQIAISLIIGIKIATFDYIIFIENNEKIDTICTVDIFVIIKSIC